MLHVDILLVLAGIEAVLLVDVVPRTVLPVICMHVVGNMAVLA